MTNPGIMFTRKSRTMILFETLAVILERPYEVGIARANARNETMNATSRLRIREPTRPLLGVVNDDITFERVNDSRIKVGYLEYTERSAGWNAVSINIQIGTRRLLPELSLQCKGGFFQSHSYFAYFGPPPRARTIAA